MLREHDVDEPDVHATKPTGAEFSLTASRTLGILSMFSPTRPQLSLAEISRDTKLSKPSVMRFMQALIMHGYVEQDRQTKKYRPGFETFRVGSLVGGWGIRTMATPIMRAVVEKTGFTTYISVMRADRMVVMGSVEGTGPLRFTVPVGEVIPLSSTSSGQAGLAMLSDDAVTQMFRGARLVGKTPSAPATVPDLLHRLRDVRTAGYAVSWEMSSPGVGSVSSAAAGADGTLAAVLTLSFGTGQVDRADCDWLGAEIGAAARKLAELLRTSAGFVAG